MIRKIIKENPHTDICLIYTIYTNQTTVYQKGDVPQVIKRLEDIATYYQLPSIHLGMEAAALEKAGKLLWKGTKEVAVGKILFSMTGYTLSLMEGTYMLPRLHEDWRKYEKKIVLRRYICFLNRFSVRSGKKPKCISLHRLLLLIIHGKRLIHQ